MTLGLRAKAKIMKGMTRKSLVGPTVNTTSCAQPWLEILTYYFKDRTA